MNHRGLRGPGIFGLGTLLWCVWFSFVPGQAGVLRNFIFQVGADRTEIRLQFDQPVEYQVTETGTEIRLQFPPNTLSPQLPTVIPIGSAHVDEVRIRQDTGTVRVLRTQAWPYTVHWQSRDLVITVREEAVPSAPAEISPAEAPPAPQQPPVITDPQILTATPAALRMQLAGDGDTVHVRWRTMRLTEPNRLVVDLFPVRFHPRFWKRSLTHAWVRQIRIAQFQTDPEPVTRVVFEVTTDLDALDLSVTPQSRAIEVHVTTSQSASDDTPPESETPVETPSDTTADRDVPETDAPPVATASPPETTAPAASGSTRLPDALPVLSAPNDLALAELPPSDALVESDVSTPARSEATLTELAHTVAAPPPATDDTGDTQDWDASFFNTRDIVFYQAEEEAELEEAVRRAQELDIFKTRVIRGEKKYKGEPITLQLTGMHIRDFMVLIGDISGLNIVLDPKVEGEQYRIPYLSLRAVPWDQALDIVLNMLGLGAVLEGTVLRIAPIEDLQREAEERQRLEENVGVIQTVIKPLSYANAGEVAQLAEQLLSPRGQIFIDERTNTLIIKETETNMQNILNLIETLDQPIPQVTIEVRIVETRRTFTQQLGIQWGFRGLLSPALGNATTLVFPNSVSIGGNVIQPTTGISGNPLGGYAVNLPSLQAPTGAVLLSFGSVMDTFRLDMALMALESAGLARVLSSPRIMTQNNQTADIQTGDQIPVQTIVNNTIQVQYVPATLRLEVTPQITAEGSVIMRVKVENKRPDFSRLVLGIPPIITQEAETVLLVKDGATVVLGGIIRATEETTQARIPWIHKIPIIGWFFKNRNITRENNELLIFLTPRIVKPAS